MPGCRFSRRAVAVRVDQALTEDRQELLPWDNELVIDQPESGPDSMIVLQITDFAYRYRQ